MSWGPEHDIDGLEAARQTYIEGRNRPTMLEVAEDFKEYPGCSLSNLQRLSMQERWCDQRSEFWRDLRQGTRKVLIGKLQELAMKQSLFDWWCMSSNCRFGTSFCVTI